MKILQWITSLVKSPSYQDSVEQYLAIKHPTSTAEVEYWIQQFNQKQKNWVL